VGSVKCEMCYSKITMYSLGLLNLTILGFRTKNESLILLRLPVFAASFNISIFRHLLPDNEDNVLMQSLTFEIYYPQKDGLRQSCKPDSLLQAS
jgi:hypothetical protein